MSVKVVAYMQCGHREQYVTRLRDIGRVRTVVVRHVLSVVVLDPRQVPDNGRRTDVERLHQTSFLRKNTRALITLLVCYHLLPNLSVTANRTRNHRMTPFELRGGLKSPTACCPINNTHHIHIYMYSYGRPM